MNPEKMKKGKYTDAQQIKIAKVMGEFKDGTLRSSSGEIVTERDQAIAIAMSEAGVSMKKSVTGVGVTFLLKKAKVKEHACCSKPSKLKKSIPGLALVPLLKNLGSE